MKACTGPCQQGRIPCPCLDACEIAEPPDDPFDYEAPIVWGLCLLTLVLTVAAMATQFF